jgi:hypothetical protein
MAAATSYDSLVRLELLARRAFQLSDEFEELGYAIEAAVARLSGRDDEFMAELDRAVDRLEERSATS